MTANRSIAREWRRRRAARARRGVECPNIGDLRARANPSMAFGGASVRRGRGTRDSGLLSAHCLRAKRAVDRLNGATFGIFVARRARGVAPHSDARPRDAAADARARADELSPTARRGATRERRAMTTMGRAMTTTSRTSVGDGVGARGRRRARATRATRSRGASERRATRRGRGARGGGAGATRGVDARRRRARRDG